MKKQKRDDGNESSVQVALGELMGIEEERQCAEREEERRRAEEEARRRAEEEKRRAAEEQARREAADARRRAEEQAREQEAWERQREAAEREARIRAEAEAQVRTEELRRAYKFDLQRQRIEGDRRKLPPWLAPAITALSLCGVGLFAALFASVQASAAERLAEAERSKSSLRVELEREIDAERAERLNAVSRLAEATARFEDAQRRLGQKCDAIPVMSKPAKPRPGGQHGPGGRPAGQSSGIEEIGGLGTQVSDDPLDESIDLTVAQKGKKGQP